MNLAEWKAKGKPALDRDGRNRIVHESLGNCVHEWQLYRMKDPAQQQFCTDLICGHCKRVLPAQAAKYGAAFQVPDYHTWQHAGPLLERLLEEDMFLISKIVGGYDGDMVDFVELSQENIIVEADSITEAIVMAYLETL